ncbi:autophagy-related protein 22-2 [Cryomyces antarcticus]
MALMRDNSGGGDGSGTGARGYEDEDMRQTSRKELWGFYAYGWAAEVFVVCGIGSFVPIILEQLARERGVLQSDKTTPCRTSPEDYLPPGVNSTSTAGSASSPGDGNGQCVVYIFGAEINTASFAMYTFSLSVLVQALVVISMAGAADHGRSRKALLLAFASVGAVATMFYIVVVPSIYLLGAFLAIVANTCFGASFVLLNSFLPLLVRHHPSVQSSSVMSASGESPSVVADSEVAGNQLGEDEAFSEETEDSTTALLSLTRPSLMSHHPSSPRTPSPELQLSTQISSYGVGIGYVGAVLMQTLSILIVILTDSSTFSLRLVLFVVGTWWLLFTIPAAFWLRPRPGPPLDLWKIGRTRTLLAYVAYAWRNLGKTVMRARRLKDVLLFLGAWFLLSDGIATVSGTAVLFAKTTLNMKPAALALINVIATLSGVIGAFTWSALSRTVGLRPSQTILACICIFEIIPLYGLLGYIPAIRRAGVGGLQQPWEMYPVGAVYGFVLGGLSSYCRSLFGELVPPGSEAAFFALYAITDKGSSVFGPAIVGAITDATGEIRPAFWFLAALIGLPFPLMYMVDVERGKREGAAMARELKGKKDYEPEGAGRIRDDRPIAMVGEEAENQRG